MARPTASHSASVVPLVGEPSKSGHRKKSRKTRSSEVLGVSNVIVLDSEDESEETPCKPSASQFGSSRDLDNEAMTLVDQKRMLSPSKSPGSKKMKNSRKRVLAVEDPRSAPIFDSKSFQDSPSSLKRSTLGVSSDANFPQSDTRTSIGPTVATAGPAVDLDNIKQSGKPKSKRKRKGGVKADLEMQSGIPEPAEQDNKENNGSDVQGGNGVKSEKKGKKRKKGADTPVDPESCSKRSQSQSDLAASNPVHREGKITSTCHQCRQRLSISVAWCRNTSGKRACTQKYCAKCLCNRYGEIVAEIQDRDTWSCPRCRGICNCSMCMKKKGLAPTGGLAKKAKAAGYSSVADLLESFPNMREERYTREETGTVRSDVKDVMPVKKQNPVGETAAESKEFQGSKSKNKAKRVKKNAEETDNIPPGGNQSDAGKKKRRRKKSEIEASASNVDVDHAKAQSSALDRQKDIIEETSTRKKKQRKSRAKSGVDHDSVRENLISGSPVEPHEDDASEEEIVLPTGVPLTKVGDLDFPPEAIGLALQILEFCSAFEVPLKLKRVKVEKILAEMLRGGTLRRGGQSDLIQLHVQLLSIILDDMDDDTNITMSAASKNCWVYHLERHVTEQYSLLKKSERGDGDEGDKSFSASTSGTKSLPLCLWAVSDEDMAVVVSALRNGVDGYGSLPITTRLQLLATLCDDTLNTKKMRDYLDKVMSSHDVEQKENREELLSVKKQAKEMLENDVKEIKAAKRDNLVPNARDLSKVQSEAAILAGKEAQLTETAAKLCGPRCDALRTEPEAVHKSGSRFWRVKGAKGRQVVVLQDIRNLDGDIPDESWSVYPEDREEEVLRCIMALNTRKKTPVRNTRRRRKRKAPVQVDCKVPASMESKSQENSVIELSD